MTKYISIDDFIKQNPVIDTKDYSKIPCKNGRFCSTENCKYLHNLKTKMCKFESFCKRGAKCNFAHSKDELYIPICKFGSKCKFTNCTFKHLKEIKPKENNKKILTPIKKKEDNLSIENFPSTIENFTNDKEITDYTIMKEIIKYTDFSIIKEPTVELMIEKYNCILDFKKLRFEF